MISSEFIHIGIGSTGGGIVRGLFSPGHFGGRIKWIDDSAHRTLRYSRERSGAPSFTFIRNPFDWYISWYLIELRYHRWRGSFHDWFYNWRGKGISLTDVWHDQTDPGCDYIGRFENIHGDLFSILQLVDVIPGVIAEKEYWDHIGLAGCTYTSRKWVEGFEQWIRPQMIDDEIRERIEEQDKALIETYGYDFDQQFYFPGGHPPSSHAEVEDSIDWVHEQSLNNWTFFVRGIHAEYGRILRREMSHGGHS